MSFPNTSDKTLYKDVNEDVQDELIRFGRAVMNAIDSYKADVDASTGSTAKKDKKSNEDCLKKTIEDFTKQLSKYIKKYVDSTIDEVKQKTSTHQDKHKHGIKDNPIEVAGRGISSGRDSAAKTTSSTGSDKRISQPTVTGSHRSGSPLVNEVGSMTVGKLSGERGEQNKRDVKPIIQDNIGSSSEKPDTCETLTPKLAEDRGLEADECHDQIAELRTKNQEYKETLQKQERDIADMAEVNTRLESANVYLINEVKGLVTRNQEYTDSLQTKENDLNKLQIEHGNIEKSLEEEKVRLQNEVRDRNERKQHYKDTVAKRESEVVKLQIKLEKLTKENERLHADNKDLIGRMGNFASDKIQQENPDVADLGDSNRAVKLADMYKEIYDQTWTAAFRAEKKLKPNNEKEIIANLLKVLKDSFTHCEDIARSQEYSLRNLLLHPVQDNLSGNQPTKTSDDIHPQLLFKMKDMRKKLSITAVEEVKQAFWEKNRPKKAEVKDDDMKLKNASKDFYRKCVEVCWPMVLHNPPLYMEFDVEHGESVNKEFYTLRSTGKDVDFLVWPPLFLGKNQDLLAKGVVHAIRIDKK